MISATIAAVTTQAIAIAIAPPRSRGESSPGPFRLLGPGRIVGERSNRSTPNALGMDVGDGLGIGRGSSSPAKGDTFGVALGVGVGGTDMTFMSSSALISPLRPAGVPGVGTVEISAPLFAMSNFLPQRRR